MKTTMLKTIEIVMTISIVLITVFAKDHYNSTIILLILILTLAVLFIHTFLCFCNK